MFDGDLVVQSFERGVALAHAGQYVRIRAEGGGKRGEPYGDIGKFYQSQNVALGSPLRGEYSVFGDDYRLHFFEKGLLAWRRSDRRVEVLAREQDVPAASKDQA